MKREGFYDKCEPCPVEIATCNDGGITQRKGFWRPTRLFEIDFLYEAVPCLTPHICLESNECLTSHSGFLCQDCIQGYSKSFIGYCQGCEDSTMDELLSLFLVIILFFFFLFVISGGFDLEKGGRKVQLAKILLRHLQICFILMCMNKGLQSYVNVEYIEKATMAFFDKKSLGC
jgi:hypothetical protein